MRPIRLALILVGAAATTLAQDKNDPPAPDGCQYTAFHAYSECRADDKGDKFWYVVTDGLYACGNGQAPGRKRVHETKTAQPCDGKNKVKAPEAQTEFTVGLQGGTCQSPAKDGELWVQRCIEKIWYNVKYLRYRCLDGSIRLDAPKYYSTGKACGLDEKPPELDPGNPGTAAAIAAATLLDFGQPESWGPPQNVSRETDTQLMMIDMLNLAVPGTRSASADPLHLSAGGLLASLWNALSHAATPSFAMNATSPSTRGVWLEPRGWSSGGLQGVTRATRVHAYLTSLGSSTGEAFDLTVVNDGPTPVQLTGDGIVVEPIRKGSDKALRSELLKAAATRGPVASASRLNAYCLEFKLKPPETGMMFHVVEANTQQKYGPAREILRASRRLQAANELKPDSDPADYFHSIRQWAIWVSEQHFTQPQYQQAFIDRTKKNVTALNAKWSKQIEDGINALAPHRWDEIAKILRAAGQPVPGA